MTIKVIYDPTTRTGAIIFNGEDVFSLAKVTTRGLNTWSAAPEDLVDLADRLKQIESEKPS